MGFLGNMVNAGSDVARGDHCTGSNGPGSVERQRAVSIGAIQSRYSDSRSWEREDADLRAIYAARRRWSPNDRDKGVPGARVAGNNATDGDRRARGSQANGRKARLRRRTFQRLGFGRSPARTTPQGKFWNRLCVSEERIRKG
jgi:hypothetical protein